MVKILALDYGAVRVGIAIADTTIGIAHARQHLMNTAELFAELATLCTTERIEQVLVGQPRTLAGTASEQTTKAETFAVELDAKLLADLAFQKACPAYAGIELVDERFSTVSASANLTQAGIKTKAQKNLIDSEAARIFLQAWLEQV